jgi:hypothetical protein
MYGPKKNLRWLLLAFGRSNRPDVAWIALVSIIAGSAAAGTPGDGLSEFRTADSLLLFLRRRSGTADSSTLFRNA